MPQFKNVDDVLNFAIAGEMEARDFYISLAKKADRPWMAEVFKEFAAEEEKHRMKLVQVKQGGDLTPLTERILDLKIADYLSDVAPTHHLTFQEALVVAMKREKESFRMYTDLASAAPNDRIRDAFQALAQEEAKHKLRIELMYDEQILKDN
jgi:rubrerythrin